MDLAVKHKLQPEIAVLQAFAAVPPLPKPDGRIGAATEFDERHLGPPAYTLTRPHSMSRTQRNGGPMGCHRNRPMAVVAQRIHSRVTARKGLTIATSIDYEVDV